jgi:pantothenate kinase type III
MVDGLIRRIKEEAFGNEPVTILSTGGMGRVFAEYSKFEMIYEPNLIPMGLYFMHKRLTEVGK